MNKIFLKSILILLSFFLYSEEPDGLLKFSRDSWNIAIESFSGQLSRKNEYLKSSIPDLIRKELLSVEMHILSGKEISNYQHLVLSEKKKEILNALSTEYNNKDNLLFSDDHSLEAYLSIEAKINLYKKSLEALKEVNPAEINTADILRISWIGSGEDGSFLPTEIYTKPVISSLYDLDYLISGEIKEIDEYFYLEISGFNRCDSESVQIYSKAVSPDEIELMAIEVANELRSVMLGRAWSKLIVVTDHPDALIYSDGVLIGIGSADVNTLEPGTVMVEAIDEDTSYWSEEVVLEALEQVEVSGSLSVSDVDFMTLNTAPSGANVYMGARWIGSTPLNIPRYGDKNIWISIQKKGFYSKSFEVSSQSPSEMFYDLEVEEISRSANFDLQKKAFYRSLGRFSLSLAAPVIMGGVYSNYADRYNGYATEYNSSSDSADYDMAEEMKQNYYISYGVFWGTVGISSGLLVDVFVKLSRYIKAAELLTE